MDFLLKLFTSYETWIAVGAVCQLSMIAWMRQPKGWLWAIPVATMPVCLLAAAPTAGTWPDAYIFGVGLGLVMSAVEIAIMVPARMDEGVLLGITTAFWLRMWPLAATHVWWLALAAVPSLIVLAGAAATFALPADLKLGLYVWALAALSVLGVLYFPHIDFAPLSRSGREWVMILAASWLGAYLAMLAHNVGSLFMLLPLPEKDTPYSESLKRARDYARLLIANYSSSPITRAKALVVVAVQLALYAASRSWAAVSQNLALQACLSLALLASVVEVGPSISAEDSPGYNTTDLFANHAQRRRRARAK